MLKIGIAGLGFMGQMHYRCWKAREDAQIVAICDTNKNIVEDCKKTVGNIEGTEAIDFTGINIPTSVRCWQKRNWTQFHSRCRPICMPSTR
ncbi:MAG: Gfo/Idh/MocA family oxidoreductase [Planctomycetota bacterium]